MNTYAELLKNAFAPTCNHVVPEDPTSGRCFEGEAQSWIFPPEAQIRDPLTSRLYRFTRLESSQFEPPSTHSCSARSRRALL